MADFQEAIKIVLTHEGNYANRKNDKGGETYCGIARKKHPGWSGWEIIDECRNRENFPKNLDAIKYLQKIITDFYYEEFWLKISASKISSQKVANKLMDMSVLMGIHSASVCLQRALFSCGYLEKISLADGIIGEKTLCAINNVAEYIILPSFKSECAGYYRCLNDEENINGWLKRAYE
jgi:lysozyme family protein